VNYSSGVHVFIGQLQIVFIIIGILVVHHYMITPILIFILNLYNTIACSKCFIIVVCARF
jgi:hypothetical protein